MCAGFTFSQPAPRLPASYGASSAFTITPSWPRASASSRNACATPGSSVSTRGTTSSSGRLDVERGEPLARRTVDEVLAVDVEAVEEEGARAASLGRGDVFVPKRLIVTWNGSGRPSARSAIASPSRTIASHVERSHGG